MVSIKSLFRKLSLPIVVSSVYLFLYLPIFILVIFSFNNAAFPSPWKGFSLRWYNALFNSPDLWRAFNISLIVAVTATLLSLLIALSIVYYSFMGGKLKNSILFFYGNIAVPEIVLGVSLLGLLSYMSIPLGMLSIIVAHTALTSGVVIPIIYNRYLLLNIEYYEASLDLGATKAQTFFKVTLPLLAPALIASGLLAFILSFDDFVLSFFTAGSESQTLSLYIYSMIRAGVSPVVNAMSTILLFFSSLLVLLFCFLNVRTKIF